MQTGSSPRPLTGIHRATLSAPGLIVAAVLTMLLCGGCPNQASVENVLSPVAEAQFGETTPADSEGAAKGTAQLRDGGPITELGDGTPLDPVPLDPQGTGLYFTVNPVDGPRDLTVTASAHTVNDAPLPRGTYTWVFDDLVDAGPLETHATMQHTFSTGGQHIVGLTLTLAGVALPIGCRSPGGDRVTVWPVISGQVADDAGSPMSGVRVVAASTELSALTDSAGHFLLAVPYDWSGTITPSVAGYAFDPPERSFSSVRADASGADFAAVSTVHIPQAFDQAVQTNEDAAVDITLSGTIQDGSPLSYVIATYPSNGVLTDAAQSQPIHGEQLPYLLLTESRRVRYTPLTNFHGTDSFTFRVGTLQRPSVPATVTIAVLAVNDPPTADAQSVTVNEDIAKTITLSGSDPDQDPLTYSILTLPTIGTLKDGANNHVVVTGDLPYTLAGGGRVLTYTNNLYHIGADGFTFRVSDGQINSSPSAVSLSVLYGNHAPIANPQQVTAGTATPKSVVLTATDPHNDPLTFAIATPPAHGSLTGTPPNVTYTSAAGYAGQDSFTFTASDYGATSPPAAVTLTIGSGAWAPPIGIPAPSFGIAEAHTMYVGQPWNYGSGPEPYRDAGHGPYTHYVDNTNSQATDSNNTFGTPTRPRLTIPTNLPAGSVVEVHGGPYTFTVGGRTQFTANGTAANPVFIRGIGASNRPVFTRETEMNGTYLIIEYLEFNTPDGVYVNSPGHHISLRHSLKHGGVGQYNSGLGVGGDSPSSQAHDIVFYDDKSYENGDWQAPPEQGDQDYHGFHVSSYAYNFWLVYSEMYHNSGDGIQINAGQGQKTTAHHLYVGRNTAWENRQTGFWCKQASDVIFSQNTSYGHLDADSSGAGMGWQYEHDRIWYIYNHCYNNLDGIRGASADGDVYIIGNVLHDNSQVGVNAWNNTNVYVLNNTIYQCGYGICVETSTAMYAANNIVANLTKPDYYHLYIFGGGMPPASQARNNLFYQAGGQVRIEWDSNPLTVPAFQSAYGVPGRIEGNREGDPRFVNPAVADFHVQTGSPAIDNGAANGIVQTTYDGYQTRYGVTISVAYDGAPRPQSGGWDIGALER